MKKFTTPEINIQKLESESVMATSVCFEAFECKECYCGMVQCGGTYDCTGLTCPGLSQYE